MGRSSRFEFPIPGRKANTSRNVVVEERVPIVRIDGPINTSKAEKLLGHSAPSFSGPALSSMTPAELSHTDILPGLAPTSAYEAISSEDHLALPSVMDRFRPRNVSRASSHALGMEEYRGTSFGTSIDTSTTRNVSHKDSSSTIRSFYDARKSPPAVSQQTSASAVRDMALRKGLQPLQSSRDLHDRDPSSNTTSAEDIKPDSKRRPPMLDLSRLFPKPKSHEHSQHGLLSPNKFVNSPTQLSITSDYSSRSRKLRKTSIRSQKSVASSLHAPSQTSSVRSTDPSENAKTNVRRPPKGIQHWFDAIPSDDDDSDELMEPLPRPSSRQPVKPPTRKSSLNQVLVNRNAIQWDLYHTQQNSYYADVASPLSEISPRTQSHRKLSQTSLQSHLTDTSARTKESKMSQVNLRTTSALSMSSSDEDETRDMSTKDHSNAVRQSLAVSEIEGEIIIGKAQAYELNSHSVRRPSIRSNDSRASAHTLSSNAGTIEMCYTPLPPIPSLGPMFSQRNRTGRMSHAHRHPVIVEDDTRPRTAHAEPSTKQPYSPASEAASINSINTSRSEPKAPEQRRLMAVTEEEEALLEMMRQKRAAMANQSFSQGYQTALEREKSLQAQGFSPEDGETTKEPGPRTSGFLRTETPTSERINSFPAPTSMILTDPTLGGSPIPPQRKRQKQHKPARINTTGVSRHPGRAHGDSSILTEPRNFTLWRDSELVEVDHFDSPGNHSSDPLPSPCQTGSIASATSASHPSPLPSPVTPSASHTEQEMRIKVASSDPSCSGDDDEESTPPHMISDLSHPRATVASTTLSEKGSQRTLTAQSSRPVTPNLDFTIDARSSAETTIPQRTTSRRVKGVQPNRTSRASIVSASGQRESKMYRNANRESVAPSIAASLNTRCSVSEDILAAWGSLGGWRDYDMGKQPQH